METEDVFRRYNDISGESYYCSLESGSTDTLDPKWDASNCVEASTVDRYSGNIEVVDRF